MVSMEDKLRHYVTADQKDWDQHLDMAEFAVNSAVQGSTKMSPFELVYSYPPRTPTSVVWSHLETANEARVAMRNASQRMKQHYDTPHKSVEVKKGDWVLLSAKKLRFKGCPKLLPRWVGPLEVGEPLGKVAL